MRTRSQSRNNFPQQEASPAIVNFELKHGLINLVQNKQFFGHDKEDPHAHIRYFNNITSTMRVPNVPSSSIKLMLFPFSLEGAAQIWLEKEPSRSILTWDDLVTKFINQFFPLSKTTNLRNEITRFQQRFDESFYEAWDRFNDLLRACPHHGFSELHQLDTFYNTLNVNDQDSLNSAAGGNFLDKMPRECLKIIESKSKVRQSRAKAVVAKVSMSSSTPAISSEVAELKDMVRALLLDKKNQSSALVPSPTPAPVKAVEPNCVTCGGMDECLALADLGASINLMPLSMWEGLSLLKLTPTCMTLELVDRSVSKPIGIAKDVSVKVGVFHFPADFVVVDFEPDPRVPLILRSHHLQFGSSRYLANYNQMTANKIDVIDMACEEYSQEVLGFTDVTTSGNPTPYDDPIVSTTSPTLTPFGDSDFLLFEEADAFLGLEDDPNSPEFNLFYYDLEGDILLLETILNNEPFPPFPNHEQYTPSFKKELKVCEAKTVKSFIDEPPEVELKDLPPHLEYAFLEGDNKLPGINLEFCTHKILMEGDYKPAVQHQRRVNPKIHDVIRKEVEKLLDAGLIYPISDSLWVSPVHCVPKKGGFTIVENEENELIPTRLVIGWRGMNTIVSSMVSPGIFKFPLTLVIRRKPHSPDHTERLSMSFGLCNAPGTFQRCMLAIFHDMVEKTMEVFMDDFPVFGNSFENCLSRLDKMLQRCEDTNLCLNWEKSYFMVKEGIVLSHKISKNGIEVDKAKVDVIAKLPHPTTVKGVRSFLGRAGFYRRFFQDFSKISRPMTHLLEKNTPFIFSEDCNKAFQMLKKKSWKLQS
nr:hypothetical protein [Tanacetum cinerariifolium]